MSPVKGFLLVIYSPNDEDWIGAGGDTADALPTR